MGRIEKWKLGRYLKRVRKAYKKMYKKTTPDMQGHFFYNLQRTESLLKNFITEDNDIARMKQERDIIRKKQKILRDKVKNMIKTIKIRKSQKLNYQDLIYERKLLVREYEILISEENLLSRDINKDVPNIRKFVKKDLEKQFQILLGELEAFELRVEEAVQKGDISKRDYSRHFKRYITPLRKFHKTFFFQ